RPEKTPARQGRGMSHRQSTNPRAYPPTLPSILRSRTMRFLQAVILLAFLSVVLLFAAQNTQPITVHFLDKGLDAPVALLIVGVYLLGMLTGWTVVAFLRRSIRRVSEPRD